MCIDLFAVCASISIGFLHEQLTFTAAHAILQSEIVCDAFVTNESQDVIKSLRLQFPHYISPDEVSVLSTTKLISNGFDFRADRDSWIGDYRYDHRSREVSLTLRPPDSNVELHGEVYRGVLLEGDFWPHGVVPAGAGDGLLLDLEEMDFAVLDLVLSRPLEPGRTGWLRLRLLPAKWPDQEQVVALPQAITCRDSYEFLSRISILSPLHLRRAFQRKLERKPFDRWHDYLITKGWRSAGTLSRIEDHRISLVFPRTVSISHVVTLPESAVVNAAQAQSVSGGWLLHFITGSSVNRRSDIVINAKRIYDYFEFVKRTDKGTVTTEHLVNRFGAPDHEAVGTFIKQMRIARVINYDQACHDLLQPCLENEYHERLLELRRRYSFPDPDDGPHFLRDIRDLHPFKIGFEIRWTALNAEQRERSRVLNHLVDAFSHREPAKRRFRAMIVACSDYEGLKELSYPEIFSFSKRLIEALNQKTVFHVDDDGIVENPRYGEEIINRLHEMLSRMSECDVFLFWYLGHARPDKALSQLELQLCAVGSLPLSWETIRRKLNEFKNVQKIAIFDCCNAGMIARNEPPDNCLLWPTTGPNHAADGGKHYTAKSDAGEYVNFTHHAAETLCRLKSTDQLKIQTWLQESQKLAVLNDNEVNWIANGFDDLVLTIDPSEKKMSDFDRVVQQFKEKYLPNL